MNSDLNYEDFSGNLNTDFQVTREDYTTVALKLVEVSDLKESPRQSRFSITFAGPVDDSVGQGLYKMSHGRIGEFELFIVPVGKNAEVFFYEAVFNRLKEPAKNSPLPALQ
jgi:hypothetical protein